MGETSSMVTQRKKTKSGLWIVGVIVALAILMFGVSWLKDVADSYYSAGFRAKQQQVLKRTQPQQTEDEEDEEDDARSQHAQPKGFRESDIRKIKGNRYETY